MRQAEGGLSWSRLLRSVPPGLLVQAGFRHASATGRGPSVRSLHSDVAWCENNGSEILLQELHKCWVGA